jgi:hypothetical protein
MKISGRLVRQDYSGARNNGSRNPDELLLSA